MPDSVKKWALPFFLFFAVCAAYANSLSSGFVWDDNPLIVKKQNFFSQWQNISTLVTSADSDNDLGSNGSPYYRPLGTFTYMLDSHFWGLSPFWCHLENVLLHALVVALFYILLAALFEDRRTAFLLSFLFALYPVNTEAVDLISARNTILCAAFSLASLVFLKKGGIRWTLLAILSFFFALLSKEQAAAIPFFLLTFSAFVREDRFKIRNRTLAGFFAVLGVYFLLRHVFLGSFTSREGILLSAERLKFVLSVYFENFRLMLLPFKLNAFHAEGGLAFNFLKASAALSGIALLVFFSVSKKIPWPVRAGAQWVFWGLLLISNIVRIPSAPVAERYLYIIVPGFVLMVGYALGAIYKRKSQLSIAAVLLLCILFGVRTFTRNYIWQDDLSLYKSMVLADPENSWAHCNLGVLYAARNNMPDSRTELQRAVTLDPNNAAAHMDLGTLYYNERQLDAAVRELTAAVRLVPGYAHAHLNLGLAYNKLGFRKDAAREFQAALDIDPAFAEARDELNAIRSGNGNL